MIKFQKLPLIFLLCFLFINISFAKEIFTTDFERKSDTKTKNFSDDFFCIKSSKKYIPGPLSEMEKGLEKFKKWYLKTLLKSLK